MNGSLAMRSSRLRTLLLVLVGGGMLLSIYLLTSSQYHLKDARNSLEACLQQKDSLLAQLQVVYEQKNRVEKSLQQEKLDHKKTQQDNQRNNYLRLQVQKAKLELDTRVSALLKDQQILQEKYHELESQTTELKMQQAEFSNNIKLKEKEITLLHGNLTLALQEKETMENQVVLLNRNIQQYKNDIYHYKKMYLDLERRLKKISLSKVQEKPAETNKPQMKQSERIETAVKKIDDTNNAAQDANKLDSGKEHVANDNGEKLSQAQATALHSDINQAAHESHQQLDRVTKFSGGIPKPAREPAVEPHRDEEEGFVKNPVEQPNLQIPNVAGQENENQQRNEDAAGHPPYSLRQQLQPPDFPKQQEAHPGAEPSSSTLSSPGQVPAVNQPLLPPPPPNDGKEMNPNQQSQEQKDQDTMARKPIAEQIPAIQKLGHDDMRDHESMFLGGAGPWNQLGDGMAPIGQEQIRSPDIKPKGNNLNNGQRPDEDDNYPEDGDDDNAEEQDENLHEKHPKPFQDHDFEDNDGNEHNHAKEEGIVIAPK